MITSKWYVWLALRLRSGHFLAKLGKERTDSL
jgi:hypothetical protein